MGMGHVQQSTTLAKLLCDKAEVFFLTKSDQRVLDAIRGHGFDGTQFDGDLEILAHLALADPDVIIFDKIDVSEQFAIEIRRTLRAGLVIFTNLTKANLRAHIAVIADIGSCFKNIRSIDGNTGTVYYHGPKYWVLRNEFYEYRKKDKIVSDGVNRVLLIFGGSDPSNLTSVVLDELLSLGSMPKIDVVLGAHFGHEKDLAIALVRHPKRSSGISIHRNVNNIAELMYAADLVIASPGLSAFEALCVGTPVIVMPHDSLQRDTYRGFLEMLESKDVRGLGGLIERGQFTYPHSESIVAMEIGHGVAELVSEIMKLGKKVAL